MIKKEEITVNKSHWENMNSDELEIFANKIFQYYRENGFPYFPTDIESRMKDFNTLKKFDFSNIIQDDVVNQTMHGLGLAWSYFPHAFEVKCGNKMTPYEAFIDDEIFMRVIRRRLKMGTYISDSGIRKMLKLFSNVQSVSNFRPTAAAAIYNTFAKNGVVWDMSGGWGGRLLGAIVSNVGKYIATEPSTKTYEGLRKLGEDFGKENKWEIYPVGSEDFLPIANSLDLCFTSPPYFNQEKYADEPTQSYIKYPTREEWIEGFLIKTFENCHWGLKDDGLMIINIADVIGRNSIKLEEDTIKSAEKAGFKLRKKFYLALSNVNMRNKENKHKFEPMFLFTK
jgi:hypothetical protein